MSTKIANAQHTATAEQAVDHRNLKARMGTALVAGCLALSLAPTAAFAAPASQGDMQQGGTPPAAMQQNGEQQGFDGQQQNGQQGFQGMQNMGAQQGFSGQPSQDQNGNQASSSWSAAPDQQAGNNQPGQNGQQPGGFQNNALDDQIRQILANQYGVELPGGMPSTEEGMQAFDAQLGSAVEQMVNQRLADGSWRPGDPADAPELPEGAINVQAVIDSVRDMLREYGAESLENADFSNAEFTSQLSEFVQTAMEERIAMFESGQVPEDMTQPPSAPETASFSDQNSSKNQPSAQPGSSAASQPNSASGDQPAGQPADQQVDGSLLSKLISFLAGLFGFSA